MESNYDEYDTGLKKGALLNNGRFEIIEKIGQGGFGLVYSAHDNENRGEKCAIKMIESLVLPHQDLKSSIKEIDFLIKYQNKYIVKYISHFVFAYRPCIVTSFYKEGDLDNCIKEKKDKNEKFDTIDILFWLKQILEGLDFLHSNNIIHRDLKPSNIFINGGSLVLGDLGLAKSLEGLKKSKTFSCTLFYASPEVIDKKDYNLEVDIWSFGCILYELVELEKAFDGRTEFHIFKGILENPMPQLKEPYLNYILSKSLKRNPSERANTKELIEIIKKGYNADLNLIAPEKESASATVSHTSNRLISDPANELRFKGPFNDYVAVPLKIENPTEKKIAFKIKTTAQKRYTVKPNKGFLDPKQSISVNVLLQPFNYDPNEKYNHKFKIEYIFLNDAEIKMDFSDISNMWEDLPEKRFLSLRLLSKFEINESELEKLPQLKPADLSIPFFKRNSSSTVDNSDFDPSGASSNKDFGL